jgi:hypothetical protein
MKSNVMYHLTAILLILGAAVFVRCNDSGYKHVNTLADSTTPKSSPDNNSANNPSLADTAYEGNRTKPITDTMKRDTAGRPLR